MTICHLKLAITVPLLECLVLTAQHPIQQSRLFSYKGEFCIPALLLITASNVTGFRTEMGNQPLVLVSVLIHHLASQVSCALWSGSRQCQVRY